MLNFALTLEYLEAAFYKTGNGSSGLIPAEYRALFRTIGEHETAHVALLQRALGAAAVKAPKVDFTAGGKYADVFSNFKTFATLSATFEDLGVAAYKGQAGNLAGTPGADHGAADPLGRGAPRRRGAADRRQGRRPSPPSTSPRPRRRCSRPPSRSSPEPLAGLDLRPPPLPRAAAVLSAAVICCPSRRRC